MSKSWWAAALESKPAQELRWLMHGALSRLLSRFVTSAVLSQFDFRIIRIKRLGTDVLHTWKNGALVWDSVNPAAPRVVDADLPLYTFAYTPRSGDILIFLGAGVGYEIPYFSRLVGPAGKIFAVEPDANCARRLSLLVEHLKLENVSLIEAAVSDFSGFAPLTQEDPSGTENHLSREGVSQGSIVRVCTLGELEKIICEPTWDFLKINIEGEEYKALSGLTSSVSVKNIAVSCHDFLGPEHRTMSAVIDLLEARNYQVIHHPPVDGQPWVGSYVYGMLTE